MIKIIKYMILIGCVFLIIGGVSLATPNETEAQNKLSQITVEEQAIIESLFMLSSEIEMLNTQLIKLGEAIQNIESDIKVKEGAIATQESTYKALKDNLGEVLRIQQRAGIASNIEIVLGAKNLKDLVDRINLLRDLSKNVDNLMNKTESVRLQLVREREKLDDLLIDMENQEDLLAEAAVNKMKAKLELETYLEGLASEKAHYQDYLESIESLWASLKPLFAETIQSFTEIIEKGDLPDDTVEVNVSLFGARGTIREDKFNALLDDRDDLPVLSFNFKDDGVSLSFPSYEIELDGYFELIDSQTIQYVVTGGAFYNLPMSQSALSDLFSAGDLVFNLKSILGKNTIKKITNFEDRLELQITISLF
jgi:peptidoglycan hydrolase CwlO-like protein